MDNYFEIEIADSPPAKKRKKEDVKRNKKLLWNIIIAALIIAIILLCVNIFRGTLGSDKKEISNNLDSLFGETKSENTSENWTLTLVNKWNTLPSDYNFELTELSNGEKIDSRVYPYLQKMFDAARADGVSPLVNSGYRHESLQRSLLNQKINDYKSSGFSEEEAKELALGWVAEPGTSEHELGLAIDIDYDWDSNPTSADLYSWLENNAHNYGFIMRYPENKVEITGVNYEPWHYRYVGEEIAKEIVRSGLCLEEYIDSNK